MNRVELRNIKNVINIFKKTLSKNVVCYTVVAKGTMWLAVLQGKIIASIDFSLEKKTFVLNE